MNFPDGKRETLLFSKKKKKYIPYIVYKKGAVKSELTSYVWLLLNPGFF